jgi:hypothetical protein
LIDFFHTYIVKTMGEGENKTPNCLKCIHFKITWDPDFPRACEMFGFKGHNMPSVEVLHATGQPCPVFVLKEGLK